MLDIVSHRREGESDGGRDRLRCARRGGAALQPLLHQADRPAARGLSREPVLSERGAGALRACAPREAHRGGARPRARPGRGLPEPHPARLRAAPPGRANGVESRRAPEPSGADRAGAGRLRPAPGAVARGHRRDAGQAVRRRPEACARGDEHHRGAARRATRGNDRVRAPAPPARRHGLGRPPPRRALRPGVRLGRALRGAGRRHRGEVHPALRPEAGARLDRREGRRDRRLRVPRQAVGDGGQAAPAPGRAEGARAGHRCAPRGRVRARRATHLRKRRLPPGPSGTAQELRPRPGRGDVGAPAVRLLPAAAAAATGIQVGSAIVATRFVVDQTGPASLALLRYLIGVCCLLPPVLMSAPRARFDRRDLLAIGLLGIAQFGILIALLNYGLRFVPSARAALIFATLPLLTMVVAAALGQERLTLAKLSGVLLTLAGVGLALGEKAFQGDGAVRVWVGELAVFLSAVSGAVCSVLYRPYLKKYPTLAVSAVAMLVSVGFLAVLAAGEGFFGSLPRFTAGGWLAVLYIGVGSGGGYYLWLWALGHATPTQVTVFLALSPVTATVLGAMLLGETITAPALLGLACVALGLWLAHRS